MNIETLNRQKRNVIRGLNRIKNSIEDYDSLKDLEENKAMLNQKYKDFEKTNKEIIELCSEEEIEEHFNTADEIQKSVVETNKTINKLMEKLEKTGKQTNTRLKDLELPNFCGDIMEWLSFRDLFLSSVHNNDALSDGQKLQYLKSTLHGDAGRLIKSFAITNNNYSQAWKHLNNRYNRSRDLINNHIDRLINQPNIQQATTKSILDLVDRTNECVLTLEALEQKIEGFADKIIVFILQEKLDNDTKQWWRKDINKDEMPTLKKLLEFLEKHAQAINTPQPKIAEKITTRSNNFNQQNYTQQKWYNTNQETQSRNRLNQKQNIGLDIKQNNNNYQKSCSVCRSTNHFVMQCPILSAKSPKGREEIIKEKKLCYNCLLPGHKISNCRNRNTCRICSRKHHTLLHNNEVNRTSQIYLTKEPNFYTERNYYDKEDKTLGDWRAGTRKQVLTQNRNYVNRKGYENQNKRYNDNRDRLSGNIREVGRGRRYEDNWKENKQQMDNEPKQRPKLQLKARTVTPSIDTTSSNSSSSLHLSFLESSEINKKNQQLNRKTEVVHSSKLRPYKSPNEFQLKST